MRQLAWLCLAILTATPAIASTVCREIPVADFGSVVSSPPANAFLIQKGCPENHPVARLRPPLTIRLTAGDERPAPGLPAHWRVLFDLDRSDLDGQDRSILDMVPRNITVRVDGYTCRLGPEAYNQGLSERRAAAVADYLEKRGVNVLSRAGHGEDAPVSDTNLALNRRAVVVETEVAK
ncbi:OmpA family protein [Geothermobacter hydrogeniphilus]|uniref:OmpA-like domain-containing protein n=1 Tax=Geothermobacter hydrogeniphilus TaxID=1969733 RepID=A0A1X0XX96_9BACT|nr:OmpA family protein [Geothermobacter hydrogeniphilus]ORJ57489.1 hypothetical protein B5V00_13650 [Geothermobacter hydrogeniphilus]